MMCPGAKCKNWSYAMAQEVGGKPLAMVTRPADGVEFAETVQVKDYQSTAAQLERSEGCWGGENGTGVGPTIADSDNVTPPTGCLSMPRYRHSGGANLTFTDGHVKWMRKGTLRWCRQISIAEPSATCLP